MAMLRADLPQGATGIRVYDADERLLAEYKVAGMDTAVTVSEPEPEPPTLAQIKAQWTDGNGEFSDLLRAWLPSEDEEEERCAIAIDESLCALADAAYEPGQREAISAQATRDHPIFIRGYEAGLRDAQIPPLMKMDEHGNVMVADQAEKVAQLEAWKASAMAVMAPLQDIAKEFSLPLGSSIAESVAEWVRELNSELNAAVDENAGLRAEIARLRNPVPEPVKHVASPSIGARWESGPGVLPAQMVKP